MNERIDELAFQSGITQHSYSNPKHPDLDGFIVSQEKLDKFAEMIVRECIRVPYAMWDKAELNADIAVKIEHRIKDHFGVE